MDLRGEITFYFPPPPAFNYVEIAENLIKKTGHVHLVKSAFLERGGV